MATLSDPSFATDQSRPLTAGLANEIAGWYVNKELASDWTSVHFPAWTAVLGERGSEHQILEIGSYEGRSALFFLNYFPTSTVTCIDWWNTDTIDEEIAKHLPGCEAEFMLAEGKFDRNVVEFSDRLTKIKGNSVDILADLSITRRSFDIIYVDGNHRSRAAYRDCLLGWALLKCGGMLIIDDYEFDMPGLPASSRPKDGVDAFLRAVASEYIEVHRAYQLIVKRKETFAKIIE